MDNFEATALREMNRALSHGINGFHISFEDGYCSVTLKAGGYPCIEDWREPTMTAALTRAVAEAIAICPHCPQPVRTALGETR